MLVNKDSAVPLGTPRRNTIAVDKDHSNLVKFSEDDPVYRIVMSFLLDLCKNVDNNRVGHSISHLEATPTCSYPGSLIPFQKSVKTSSTVPFPRDPNFVGREDTLAQLESEFANPESNNWASLYGLGGIGYGTDFFMFSPCIQMS